MLAPRRCGPGVPDASRALAAAVVAGFFAGGALLSADAWQRAWRPPLRIAFEATGAQRSAPQADGRGTPAARRRRGVRDVEGVLRADASPATAACR